jgi:hypothetical protein
MRKTYPAATLLRDVLRDACVEMDRAEEETVTLRSPFPRKVRKKASNRGTALNSRACP